MSRSHTLDHGSIEQLREALEQIGTSFAGLGRGLGAAGAQASTIDPGGWDDAYGMLQPDADEGSASPTGDCGGGPRCIGIIWVPAVGILDYPDDPDNGG